MKVFRRPFPKAVAGKIDSYHYDLKEKEFTLSFTQSDDDFNETVIGTPFDEIELVTVDGKEKKAKVKNHEIVIKTKPGKHTVVVKVDD